MVEKTQKEIKSSPSPTLNIATTVIFFFSGKKLYPQVSRYFFFLIAHRGSSTQALLWLFFCLIYAFPMSTKKYLPHSF